ncbi:MAG: hypothetical protein WC694_02255 [Candidatus Paceibacterota bacterium]|jgi:hypothetical protein
MKKIFSIFFIAFVSNAVWENLHSVFYANYMGGKITELILLRASFWDALIIILITLPFIFYAPFKNKSWLIIFLGIIISFGIEYYALSTHRWAYNSLMPIISFLGIGLTPSIQLGLLGYISFRITDNII